MKKRNKSNLNPLDVKKDMAENRPAKIYPSKEFYVFPKYPLKYPHPWMHPDYVEKKVKYVPRKREQAD